MPGYEMVRVRNVWHPLQANFTKRLTAYIAVAANSSICSNSVHLYVCILLSSPTNWLFSEPPIDYVYNNARNAEKWGCFGWNRIILSFSDVFKQNSVESVYYNVQQFWTVSCKNICTHRWNIDKSRKDSSYVHSDIKHLDIYSPFRIFARLGEHGPML